MRSRWLSVAVCLLAVPAVQAQVHEELAAILAKAEQGDYEGAKARFEALISDDASDSAERYAAYARFLLRTTAEFERAFWVTSRGVERYPANGSLRFWRGDALWSLGHPAAAASEYEAVLRIGAGDGDLARVAAERLSALAPILAEMERAAALEARSTWFIAGSILTLMTATWWLSRCFRAGPG